MPDSQLVSVEVAALLEDQATGSPIVVLHDPKDDRLLPIWIGDPEARAIAVTLEKARMPRPLMHKLFVQVVEKLRAKFLRVVVDRLKNNTYYASIYLQVADFEIAVDARPSDSVAVALEAKAPIFVSKAIMDEASQPNPFPLFSKKQEKREIKFNEDDLKKLKELLEKARKREQQSIE